MQDDPTIAKAGSIAAFGVALSYLASSLCAVLMPPELQGRPDVAPSILDGSISGPARPPLLSLVVGAGRLLCSWSRPPGGEVGRIAWPVGDAGIPYTAASRSAIRMDGRPRRRTTKRK